MGALYGHPHSEHCRVSWATASIAHALSMLSVLLVQMSSYQS